MSNEIAIRPKFSIASELPVNAIIEKVQLALAAEDAPFKGTIFDQHIILKIPLVEQHY